MKNNNRISAVPLPQTDSQFEASSDETETITIEQLQYLVRLIDNSDVTELEVKRGSAKTRLVLRKSVAQESDGAPQRELVSPIEEEAAAPAEEAAHTITTPFIGIFQDFSRSKNRSPVKVGDTVKKGQPVGLVLSLNIQNEIEAPVGGQVVELLVNNGQPVEYEQPLMKVIPIKDDQGDDKGSPIQ